MSTFKIEIQFIVKQAVSIEKDGKPIEIPKHSKYVARLFSSDDRRMAMYSPCVTEWDENDNRIEKMDANEAFCQLLDGVKEAIINYKP